MTNISALVTTFAVILAACATSEEPADRIIPSCKLHVGYASATSPSLGFVSNGYCLPGLEYTGNLRVTYGGVDRELDPAYPPCGSQRRISLGIDFGTAPTARFTLVLLVHGELAASCVFELRTRLL